MRQKTLVFAREGDRDLSLTDNDYLKGMEAGTVARAEDVNTYGYKSDEQLKVVSDEICNAITGQGVALNSNNNSQLSDVLRTKISQGTMMTGIVFNAAATNPAIQGSSLVFPTFSVMFNNSVMYGKSQSDFTTVTYTNKSLTPTSSWTNGVYFIYANKSGNIAYQTSPVEASDGATKCYLGSIFVINGAFQAGSWSYEPWLQQSSIGERCIRTAEKKGGLIRPASSNTLAIGSIELNQEGINYAFDKYSPNIKSVTGTSPMTYKFLYVGYDPSESDKTTLDTTHIYNMTAGTWDSISGKDGFIVMVPCIAPTGQTLMIPAMSTVSGTTYNQIFSSMEDAEKAVFSLQYTLGNVASRAIYLGQSLIVKIGATDLTDPKQLEIYGVVPESLAGFSSQGGQSGGGTGEFVPMKEKVLTGLSPQLANNTSNIVTASSLNDVYVSFPTPSPDILNQLEVKFSLADDVHTIIFPEGTRWLWDDVPVFEYGYVYTLVFEYNRLLNKWLGGCVYTTTN